MAEYEESGLNMAHEYNEKTPTSMEKKNRKQKTWRVAEQTFHS